MAGHRCTSEHSLKSQQSVYPPLWGRNQLVRKLQCRPAKNIFRRKWQQVRPKRDTAWLGSPARAAVMLDCPDLAVPREVMQHVVHVESSRNPFAIGVVGGYLARQPRNLEEALATVRQLKEGGYNFSVGISQVNRYNLAKYGLKTYEQAFEVCPNLQAGSRILRECYDRAQDWGKAFSCYYSGDFTTGFQHGYVQKVFASMSKGVQAKDSSLPVAIRVIPREGVQRRRVSDEQLPLRTIGKVLRLDGLQLRTASAYPESYPVRRHISSSKLPVAGKTQLLAEYGGQQANANESSSGLSVLGIGVVAATQTTLPESSRTQIPVQMVGVDGDPYQTRMLPLQTGFPDKVRPGPDFNQPSRSTRSAAHVAERRGGLLLSTESSALSENPADRSSPFVGNVRGPKGISPTDHSFVF